MKLIIIIAHKENSKDLEEALVTKSHQFTKMETEGGYLRKKNITYYVGAESDKVQDVLSIVKETCKTHKEIMGNPWFSGGAPDEITLPDDQAEVTVGGATVFVIEAEEFLKV